ncbi:SDR family oxidoreductase [Actinoplanes sp. NPDC051411]|uniref:SDR family oxidoreductase n=1 Tax=Actinoplanes sp. NPDC051411 TaxID=3155522 RepID=UPI003432D8F5
MAFDRRVAGRRRGHLAGEIADPAAAKRVVGAAPEHFGRVDTLINNAGVVAAKPCTEQDFPWLVSVNLAGFFPMTRPAVPHMLAQGGGHLVQLTTSRADQANHNLPAPVAMLAKGGPQRFLLGQPPRGPADGVVGQRGQPARGLPRRTASSASLPQARRTASRPARAASARPPPADGLVGQREQPARGLQQRPPGGRQRPAVARQQRHADDLLRQGRTGDVQPRGCPPEVESRREALELPQFRPADLRVRLPGRPRVRRPG